MGQRIFRGSFLILLVTFALSVVVQHTGIYILKGPHNFYVRDTGVGYWRDPSCPACSGVLTLRFPFSWRNWIAPPSLGISPIAQGFVPWWLILTGEAIAAAIVYRVKGTASPGTAFPISALPLAPPSPRNDLASEDAQCRQTNNVIRRFCMRCLYPRRM